MALEAMVAVVDELVAQTGPKLVPITLGGAAKR
jgi:hypothetical protein